MTGYHSIETWRDILNSDTDIVILSNHVDFTSLNKLEKRISEKQNLNLMNLKLVVFVKKFKRKLLITNHSKK